MAPETTPASSPPSSPDVHVERAGEEQKRQHALHQHIGEIDRAEQGVLVTVRCLDPELLKDDGRERHGQSDRHDADRHRPLQVTVIDIGEGGRQDKQDADDVEHGP